MVDSASPAGGPSAPGNAEADAAYREKLGQAQRKIAAIKGFYIHLFIFCAVMLVLFLINALAGGPWWSLWVLFGWGIGIIAHALSVFGRTSQYIEDWERRKLKELMDKR